jgi:glycosyltransferase involved in cell wall biosynthesis
MISVCIPVFNVDVGELVGSLSDQAAELSAEIILLDDGSDEKYRNINAKLEGAGVKYFEIGENIGRARIRNSFSDLVRNEYLLFLDCDVKIPRGDFLENYAESVRRCPGQVICGGCRYDPEPPGRRFHLHWKYGTRKESRPAETRNLNPHRSFMTSNFVIPKGVLKENPFDERLSEYGHEDSLFGYELEVKGHPVIHIENPVIHIGIEPNHVFIGKTAEAVRSLAFITELRKDIPGFNETITLLRVAGRIESGGIAGIMRVLSVLLLPLSRMLLTFGIHSLKLLDLYKLSLYLRIARH